MSKFPAGTVAWASDPTGAHPERPVIILSHEGRPFNSVECTVMCCGTGASDYDHYSPELKDEHVTDISFGDRTFLMPWALYTIAPGAIQSGRVTGRLTEDGETLVKQGLVSLFKL